MLIFTPTCLSQKNERTSKEASCGTANADHSPERESSRSKQHLAFWGVGPDIQRDIDGSSSRPTRDFSRSTRCNLALHRQLWRSFPSFHKLVHRICWLKTTRPLSRVIWRRAFPRHTHTHTVYCVQTQTHTTPHHPPNEQRKKVGEQVTLWPCNVEPALLIITARDNNLCRQISIGCRHQVGETEKHPGNIRGKPCYLSAIPPAILWFSPFFLETKGGSKKSLQGNE